MAHQVFVSYASEDADTASRVCALLEAEGIHCWIAPRDVKAGTDYAAAIMNAIRDSQLVVLIFSAHSNTSPYALREIDRAVAYQRPVLALRTDDTVPNSSIEYYVNAWQRLDALQGVEGKRDQIIAAVRRVISGEPGGRATAPPGAGRKLGKLSGRNPRRWAVAFTAVVLVVAVGLGLGLGLTRGRQALPGGVNVSRIAWTEIRPSATAGVGETVPKARGGYSMAYDPTKGRLILFGGGLGTYFLDDTWAYDPTANAWTDLKPSGPLPSGRSGQAMVYHPATQHLILFGGFGRAGAPNDLWAYDSVANTWTNLNPSGAPPSGRSGHAMTYDPGSDRVMLFGGSAAVGAPLNDTWAYDPATNAWSRIAQSGKVPPARSGATIVHDPAIRRLIMFGGFDDTGAALNDLWAYDAKADAWTSLEPSGARPPARSLCSMAYDPTSGRVIVFGGLNSAGICLADAWAYDASRNTWARLQASGAQPGSGVGQPMFADPASGRLMIFGPYSAGSNDYLEAWKCAPN